MNSERVSGVTLFLAMRTIVNLSRKMNFNMSLDTGFVLVGFVTVVTSPFISRRILDHGFCYQQVQV